MLVIILLKCAMANARKIVSEIKLTNINLIKEYDKNPRKNDKGVDKVANSIQEYGFNQPIVVDSKNIIIVGHTRFKAAKKLGLNEVPVLKVDLSDEKAKAYRIADNRVAQESEWDFDFLKAEFLELQDLEFDLDLTGFDELEIENLLSGADEAGVDEGEVSDADSIETDIVLGDLIEIGPHRLLCGDSTKIDDVTKLMDGRLADLAHNDPPYGMKKENDGVMNDNLNFDDLLAFNRDWISLQFTVLKENASFYCWGIDEPLMDIYSNVIKQYIKTQKATFRNLITWDKGNGQGQLSDSFRMFAPADEKCLFIMMGVQGSNNNSDNYFEGWEPIRDYLLQERLKAGWDVPAMKKIAGHSDIFRDHWTSKSQFNLPTQDVYKKFQEYCIENNIDAFKKEYKEIKKEYYSTRSYFDNAHDNMNSVWNFNRTSNQERLLSGSHATPKPIELCERVIKSSSKKGNLVIDFFLGSGSTMVAAHQLNRICYGLELSPKYCQVIIDRMLSINDKLDVKINGEIYNKDKKRG